MGKKFKNRLQWNSALWCRGNSNSSSCCSSPLLWPCRAQPPGRPDGSLAAERGGWPRRWSCSWRPRGVWENVPAAAAPPLAAPTASCRGKCKGIGQVGWALVCVCSTSRIKNGSGPFRPSDLLLLLFGTEWRQGVRQIPTIPLQLDTLTSPGLLHTQLVSDVLQLLLQLQHLQLQQQQTMKPLVHFVSVKSNKKKSCTVALTFLSAEMSRVLSACSSPCRLVVVVLFVEARASSSSRSLIFCCCRSHSEPWVLTLCSTWASLVWTCFSSAHSWKKVQSRLFR